MTQSKLNKPQHDVFDGKRIVWTKGIKNISLLIPSKKGGYLKTPIGDETNRLSDFIDSIEYTQKDGFKRTGFCNCDGLDGYVNIEIYTLYYEDSEIKNIVNKISSFLKKKNVYAGWDDFHKYIINTIF